MQSRLCRGFALFVVPLLFASGAAAQQITGRVTDAQSGAPMTAVQVFISGESIGALSQQNGRYLLLNVPLGTHTITAQLIGYRTVSREVTVTAGAPVVQDFAMTQEALGLDEIIVTGTPGGTQRRAIGNSVASVAAADVTQAVAINNMQDLLGGRSPGVQFTAASGNVGLGSAIEIRGTGSFNLGTDPIIIVDGVRVNNSSEAGPVVSDNRSVNVLDSFNPQDIESIEIIKGPAAATLYGTEASAGVIQIITKRGSEGTPQFDLAVRQGVNYMSDPAGRLGTMWACSDKLPPPCKEGETLFSYNAYDEANRLVHEGYFPDWPIDNLFQNGTSQSYNLSVRGGTQTIRYFLSTNYDYDEGNEWWNTTEALRLRANVGVVFSENVSLDVSTGFTRGDTRFGQPAQAQGGIWSDLAWSSGYCFPRFNGVNACPRTMGFQEHLPTDVAKIKTTYDFNRFTGGATLSANPFEWLSSRAIVGLDLAWDQNTTLYPLEVELQPVYQETSAGTVILERPTNYNVSLDWSTTANVDLNETWGTSTSAGVQYFVKTASNFGLRGVGFASPLSTTVNQTPPSNSTIAYDYIENKSLGFYVQEQVSWKDRVFVTGAVRLDDNSAFGSALDPEIYPKIAATWTVSEESFWGVDLINSLRLRGAWGQAGRQPDAFARVTRYGVTGGPSGTSMLQPIGPGNPAVGPETSTELEVGFDLALLDDRIAAEFSWFTQKNEAALLDIGLAPSLGSAGSIQKNLGRIDNWGWEAMVNTRLYESPSWGLTLDLTGSHVDNEIKSLGDFPGTNAIKIGYPYPNYRDNYWIESAEYDPSGPIRDAWGQRITAMCDAGRPLGDGPQYGIVRGGETVNCQDVGGYEILYGPAFYTYRASVSPRLQLLGNALALHVLIDGAYGKRNLAGETEYGHRYNNSKVSRTEDDPFWVAGDRYGTNQVWGFADASFWKLREIGARINIPESLAGRIGADRASLSLSGRELGVLWRAQKYNHGANLNDPEMARSAQAQANYRTTPALTRLNAELRVTF